MRELIVKLLIDVGSDAEAFDAVNEILREQQRSFTSTSCLLDYAIAGEPKCLPISPANYQEGDFLAYNQG